MLLPLGSALAPPSAPPFNFERQFGLEFTPILRSAILKDTAALAARYDVDVSTTLRANAAPEEAILQEIRNSGVDLIAMGVDRIQGGRSELRQRRS